MYVVVYDCVRLLLWVYTVFVFLDGLALQPLAGALGATLSEPLSSLAVSGGELYIGSHNTTEWQLL